MTYKYRYSITSHRSPRLGEPGRRVYDVMATCVATGKRFSLGCTDTKEAAVEIKNSHKAANR